MIQFRYRPDIDGLRAVAVLLVLFFHTGMGFSGGYIGVDVFFVISGFLITGLILKQQQAGNFYLSNFWTRRIRRIIPAAFVMAAVTLVVGSVLLLPKDLEQLAKSAIAQQGMVSNLFFWLNTGYFDGPAETKPLLHTWSLAVEEQFYLGFPFLLVLLNRFWQRSAFFVLLGLALISFGLSEWAVRHHPSATFFLLPTRMWELLLGALPLYCPEPVRQRKAWREFCAWAGFAGILIAGWLFDSNTRFPGAAALIPCVGTALIIYANAFQQTSLGKMLSDRRLVFVGLLSYSLYLWHWPILAYLRYCLGQNLTLGIRVAAIALSLLCAYCSWKFIETPFRQGFRQVGIRKTAWAAAACSMVLIGLSLGIYLADGLPGRLPERVHQLTVGNAVPTQYHSTARQVQKDKLPGLGVKGPADRPVKFFVWGDSHAMALAGVLDSLGHENDLRGIMASCSAEIPLLGVWTPARNSETIDWNDSILEYVKTRRVSNVILVSRWSAYIQGLPDGRRDLLIADRDSNRADRRQTGDVFRRGLERTLKQLIALDARVWIVKQVPLQESNPEPAVVRAALFGQKVPQGISGEIHRERHRVANSIIDEVAKQYPEVRVLNPAEFCFDEYGYSRIGSEEGIFYADDDHLSPLGADRLLRRMFEPVFEEISRL